MAYKSVNRAVPRIEGADKVSGNMRYAADLPFPAALSAKMLRASLPHARILGIDTSKAARLPGVRGIITGADVAGVMVGLRMKDMPLLAQDRVRYVGEPVAAVAADSDDIAEEALSLIDVQYQELPFVTDPLEAIRPGTPLCCMRIPPATKMRRSETSSCPTCSPTASGPMATSKPVFKRPRESSSILFARR